MDDYTVGLIVKEVCQVVFRNLVSKHMPVPTIEQMREIAEGYEERWNFPNVVGMYSRFKIT
jgi:hypothetical protein